MRSFGMTRVWISDPRSLGSWCIKGAEESVIRVDSSVPLMPHDPSDLGSLILIQIISKGMHSTILGPLVPLMQHDPSGLGSLILIRITPKERTPRLWPRTIERVTTRTDFFSNKHKRADEIVCDMPRLWCLWVIVVRYTGGDSQRWTCGELEKNLISFTISIRCRKT